MAKKDKKPKGNQDEAIEVVEEKKPEMKKRWSDVKTGVTAITAMVKEIEDEEDLGMTRVCVRVGPTTFDKIQRDSPEGEEPEAHEFHDEEAGEILKVTEVDGVRFETLVQKKKKKT